MNYGRRTSFQTMHPKRECPSECSDMAGSDQDIDDRGPGDESKRRTRNMSEKKRRDQFNVLISELGTLVGSKTKKMDKTSVLRSTIQLLKQYNALQSPAHEIKEDWKPASLTNDEFTQLMLEAIGGFILIFSESGVILYVSESVSPLLGYANSELINQNLFEMLAPHERSTVRSWVLERQMYSNQTGLGPSGVPEFLRVENQIQLQCQLRCCRGIGGSSGRMESTYRLVEIRGCVRVLSESTRVLELSDLLVENDNTMVCCIARVVGQPIVREIAFIPEVGVREFTTRHSMEWKYLFMDQRGPSIIGYLPFEVLGTSGFDYLHPDDLSNVARFLRQLRKSGEVTSCFYRFMTKGIQWIWLQSRAHINYNQWNSKPEFITSVNVLVSEDQVRSAVSFLDANDNDVTDARYDDADRNSDLGLGDGGDSASAFADDAYVREQGPEEATAVISSTVLTPPDCAANGGGSSATVVAGPGDATTPELQAAHVDLPCPANAAATTMESSHSTPQQPLVLHLTTAQHQFFTQLRSKHAHIRAVMRRQQAQLDRVSRVLSLAEKGQLHLHSPCPSPTPPASSSPAPVLLPTSVCSSSSTASSSTASGAVLASGTVPAQLEELMQPQHPLMDQQPQQFSAPLPQHVEAPHCQQQQQQQQQLMHQQSQHPHQQQQQQQQLQQDDQQLRHHDPQQQQQDFQAQLPLLQTYTDEVMPEVDPSMIAMLLPCWSPSLPP